MANDGISPIPAVGQIWRGINPRHGAGGWEDAEIIKLPERPGQHIILRFKNGHEYGAMPEHFGTTWKFVSHGK